MVKYHPRLKPVHGFNVVNHPLYFTWANMRYRCEDPENPSYPRYGGRGITVCQSWSESFEAFALDMGLKPSSEHTLDRKNNNEGYSKDNCRWATYTEQCLNRGLFSNNTSGATGIHVVENGAFVAQYDEEKVRYNLGRFPTLEQAVEYRNEFIYLFNIDKELALQMTERRANLNSSTKIKGISVHPEGFMTRFTLPSKERIFVGFAPTLEGAIALQNEFSELYKVNPDAAINSIKNRPRSQSSTGVKGINKSKGLFVVRKQLEDGSRKYLGNFKTLEEAVAALTAFEEGVK